MMIDKEKKKYFKDGIKEIREERSELLKEQRQYRNELNKLIEESRISKEG